MYATRRKLHCSRYVNFRKEQRGSFRDALMFCFRSQKLQYNSQIVVFQCLFAHMFGYVCICICQYVHTLVCCFIWLQYKHITAFSVVQCHCLTAAAASGSLTLHSLCFMYGSVVAFSSFMSTIRQVGGAISITPILHARLQRCCSSYFTL